MTLKPSRNVAMASLPGVEILREVDPRLHFLLEEDALAFVVSLERRFRSRRARLLNRRRAVQERLDSGWRPDFLARTRDVREADWKVPPAPSDLSDRRVEITGPVDRKMIINALNSGARVFMADIEDSCSPTWSNVLEGQKNLFDAVRRTISFENASNGKQYRLNECIATLMVRPRGWHLDEPRVLVDGSPMSASLFDFGLYLWHNARALSENGSGPYFYLPKLESHLEARLWNQVFVVAQEALGIPRGTIRATVLIETIMAAFEMDEILWELGEHASGLNCGRWDYIFSFIKRFRAHPEFVLPDRGDVGMDQPFLRAYSQLLIRTCHRRGAHAIGGMAAQIPIKSDPERNAMAMAKVQADKEREAGDGHDGTWVAHPALVGLACEVFDRVMPAPHQIGNLRLDVDVRASDLLEVPEGPTTERGLRQNIEIGVRYVEAWLRGVGCVPIHDLMEDAATAEISRTQVWQWLRHAARLEDGRIVEPSFVRLVISEELASIRAAVGEETFSKGRFGEAARLFEDLLMQAELGEFLTLAALESLDPKPESFQLR